MNEHSSFVRQDQVKSFISSHPETSPTTYHNFGQQKPIHSMAYTNSHQELIHRKEEPKTYQAIGFHSSTGENVNANPLTGSGKYDLSSSGSLTLAKTNLSNSIGKSPTTPKCIPSFLEGRNNMKSSLFMSNGEGKVYKTDSTTASNNESGHYKRLPRMSEQPDMKFSAIEFGNDHKIPSFLQDKEKKDKKVPFNNVNERPESSKESVLKNSFPADSLSSSYGSMKRKNTEEQMDPAAEWVKRSWNKKKDKKFNINDFEQIKDLGSGKYGHVFLAKEKKSNYVCALKIIEKKLLLEEEITEQFIRELKIQSFLNHPNIVHMYGFFDDHANIYIILELGTGGQLFKQMKKHQSMPEQKVASIMRQTCQAVNELHSNHIIHRDIKPENIVISEGVVKLLDFGWSVYSGHTLRSTFCGTPFYVGPEILKGNEYNEKIDIWSLGVMAYEMLIGENPFKITKEEELIKIVKDEIKIPNYVEISNEAKNFIFACLQKNPDDRFSIRELLNHEFFKKYPDKNDKKMLL